MLSQRLPSVSLESPGTTPHSLDRTEDGVKALPKVHSRVMAATREPSLAPPTMTVSPPPAVRELWSREEPWAWGVSWCRCPRAGWGPGVGSRLDWVRPEEAPGEPTLVWIQDLEEFGAADEDYLAHVGRFPAGDIVPHAGTACGERAT